MAITLEITLENNLSSSIVDKLRNVLTGDDIPYDLLDEEEQTKLLSRCIRRKIKRAKL